MRVKTATQLYSANVTFLADAYDTEGSDIQRECSHSAHIYAELTIISSSWVVGLYVGHL